MTPQFTIDPLTGRLIAAGPGSGINPMTGLPNALQGTQGGPTGQPVALPPGGGVGPGSPSQGVQAGQVGQGGGGFGSPTGNPSGAAPGQASGTGGYSAGFGGGLVNLGPTGSIAARMGSMLPGPLGFAIGAASTAGRFNNTMNAADTVNQLGLTPLGPLAEAGGVLGMNGYGALDGTGNLAAVNARGYNNDDMGALAGQHYGDNLAAMAGAQTGRDAAAAAGFGGNGGTAGPGSGNGGGESGTGTSNGTSGANGPR